MVSSCSISTFPEWISGPEDVCLFDLCEDYFETYCLLDDCECEESNQSTIDQDLRNWMGILYNCIMSLIDK